MPSKLNRTKKYKNKRRARKHGFRKRMRTKSGRNVVAKRREKGRENLTVKARRS